MANIYKQLGQGRYNDTSVNTVYTTPALTTTIIKNIHICNTTSSSATFRLFLGSSGATADQSSAIFYDFPIPPNSFMQDSGSHILSAAGTIKFSEGTANALTITIDGMEIT
jgi:hypothetical protein